MNKHYKLKPGECKDCWLHRECDVNKENIKRFLLSMGILCENGMCVEVVESEERSNSPNI